MKNTRFAQESAAQAEADKSPKEAVSKVDLSVGVLFLSGVIMLCVGAFLFSVIAGCIATGASMLGISLLIASNPTPKT